jgi:hypothetical protein
MLQEIQHTVRNHLKLVLLPHAFSNRDFEKKTPFRTQLGVHLGAFDMHPTSRTGGSSQQLGMVIAVVEPGGEFTPWADGDRGRMQRRRPLLSENP